MLKLKSILFVIFSYFIFVYGATAQILDDEADDSSQNSGISDNTDQDEALFNELFSDYSESEKDITNIKTFDDALDRPAEIIRESLANSPEVMEEKTIKAPPLTGDIYIGLTNGSFSISKNLHGETICSFSVTLKSELNHDIRSLALNLVYPYRNFAFIFRSVPANSYQERFIRTGGDICYDLDGVPDIHINKCNILAADSSECAARLKWTKDITPPDSEERRNFFHY